MEGLVDAAEGVLPRGDLPGLNRLCRVIASLNEMDQKS